MHTLLFSVPACSLIPGADSAKEIVTNEEMTLEFAFGKNTGTYTGKVNNGLPDGSEELTTTNAEDIAWTYRGEQ